MNALLEKFATAAQQPYAGGLDRKSKGGKVIGSFAMHCPAEIIHASGALPLIIQELPDPVTSGGGAMFPFFCGYTRSIVDQATEGKLEFLDGVIFADHCVQLLSAADVMRVVRPESKVHFHQLIASLEQTWSMENSIKTLRAFQEDVEEVVGVSISENALRHSIGVFNENRRLIRQIYDMRRNGALALRATEMQHIVKSSMVMDKEEHNALLRELIPMLQSGDHARKGTLPLYVSGHLCHAPRPEILDLIEDCGISIVDDDLYHGYRYVSTDVDESIGDPIVALAAAYIAKNQNAPCPTRIAPDTDWNTWLLAKVGACQAKGLIVLLAKFCEPHYFHYPRIKEVFEANNVPHLLVETEHEGVAIENLRTKVESFAEMVKRQQGQVSTTTGR